MDTNEQPVNVPAPQVPESAPIPQAEPPHRSYITAIIAIIVAVAVLAGIYLFGLSLMQSEVPAEDNAMADDLAPAQGEDDDLADIEADLEAMDVDGADSEMSEVDAEFEAE